MGAYYGNKPVIGCVQAVSNGFFFCYKTNGDEASPSERRQHPLILDYTIVHNPQEKQLTMVNVPHFQTRKYELTNQGWLKRLNPKHPNISI